MLSNPMDLTVVAHMLANDKRPDLLQLQKQEYEVMAADYQRTNLGRPFPLSDFSERVYLARLDDVAGLPEGQFLSELTCMERHKLVLGRVEGNPETQPTKRWYFRHEKIMDFFLVQAFLGTANERPQKHLADAKFRGTYLLLASLLPLAEAETLQDQLVNYAADTKDHSVSDSFVQLLRVRKRVGDVNGQREGQSVQT